MTRIRAHSILIAIAMCSPTLADGYSNYESFRQQIDDLAQNENIKAKSLAKTLGERDIIALTIARGDHDKKPGFLILGNTHAPHIIGSELAMRLASELAKDQELLKRFTFYVIPRPSPDATETYFSKPSIERNTNERKTDDDGDGEFDEDGPDDLNGDGFITMMRIVDPSGEYMEHPDDPRVLIKADPKKDEQGKFRLIPEGRDNDLDDQFDEDAAGGVAFNNNFTYAYPYYKPGAGPHQVSETESRAVADFAFDHPNIAAVFSFGIEDNLMHQWKPLGDKANPKGGVQGPDAPYFDFIRRKYQKIHGGKNAPPSPPIKGSFHQWAYMHFGRWAFSARAWWPPKVNPKKPKENGEKKEEKKEEKKDEKKPANEKRGADTINLLRWFESEKIDGFVKWTKVDHPDFPDQEVEVGGIKPFVALNPPAVQINDLAKKHHEFLIALTTMMPIVKIDRVKVDALGGNVFRVTVKVANNGYLPTSSKMGEVSRKTHPLQIKLDLPKDAKLIKGHGRTTLKPIAGRGGKAEYIWLLRTSAKQLTVNVSSPSVGSDTTQVNLP